MSCREEVEPCQETLAGGGWCRSWGRRVSRFGNGPGSGACLCDQSVLIMRAVPVPLPDVAGADKEPERGVVNMRSRTQWKEKWGG